MFGSVSGGCVEADVAERAKAVLAGAGPRSSRTASPTSEAWTRRAAVRRRDRRLRRAVRAGAADSSAARATSSSTATGVGERWRGRRAERAPGCARRKAAPCSPRRSRPPPRLVAVGAGDIAEALCALARPLGWHTVVVDPRAGLATRERVPSADEIVVAWPDEIEVDADTALVSLVHEERLDIPALRARRRGRRVLRRRARLEAHAGEAARAARRRSPTACAARSGSTSAARRRPRSRSRSSPRCSRCTGRARRPQRPPERLDARRSGLRGRAAAAGDEAEADQPDPEHEVQPVVGGVRRAASRRRRRRRAARARGRRRRRPIRNVRAPSAVFASTRPTTPKSRWTRLCRIDTWKMPSSFAPQPWPAKLRSP